MEERTGIVTRKGNPVTLVGPALSVGDMAPEFAVVNGQLAPVTLGGLGAGVKLLSVVPSLDTPVCELQTKRFYREAGNLKGVTIATVSMDLPFAQGRFCATNGIEGLQMLSDYQSASFGTAYGVLIKEIRLLARSIFVIDSAGKIVYLEIVPEVSTHPDYDAALSAAKAAR